MDTTLLVLDDDTDFRRWLFNEVQEIKTQLKIISNYITVEQQAGQQKLDELTVKLRASVERLEAAAKK